MEGAYTTFRNARRAGVAGEIVFRRSVNILMFFGAIRSAGQIGRAGDSTVVEFYIRKKDKCAHIESTRAGSDGGVDFRICPDSQRGVSRRPCRAGGNTQGIRTLATAFASVEFYRSSNGGCNFLTFSQTPAWLLRRGEYLLCLTTPHILWRYVRIPY